MELERSSTRRAHYARVTCRFRLCRSLISIGLATERVCRSPDVHDGGSGALYRMHEANLGYGSALPTGVALLASRAVCLATPNALARGREDVQGRKTLSANVMSCSSDCLSFFWFLACVHHQVRYLLTLVFWHGMQDHRFCPLTEDLICVCVCV